jgi:hypothetical protein
MASWGNQQDNRFPQHMDSNGQKLTVRNTTGPYDEPDYRVEINENSGLKLALKSWGQNALASRSVQT